MTRRENPSLHRACGLSGAAGECPGHIHAYDHAAQLVVHQCAVCGTVTDHAYDDIKAHHGRYHEAHGELNVLCLPPCPGCGALFFANHSDIEYGQELPQKFTAEATRALAAQLRVTLRMNAHGPEERFQGRDFSHLPKKDRPPHHEPVTDAQLEREHRRANGGERRDTATPRPVTEHRPQ